ncbi:MAG TPA: hypothetical protein ENH11_04550, partial [Candidatus Acetothermia bacterium]|nr:hypothetical protein [Candidatus Acetothermia bacterium]
MASEPSKTVLMIMVDALRHDFITDDDAPFLYELAKRGACGALVPPFGFEPDAAYLAGLDPDQCNGGAQYWRKPGDRLFYLTSLFRLLHLVPLPRWRRLVRHALRLTAQVMSPNALTRHMASSAQIPLDILEQFSTPMTNLACDPGFAPTPTVFDALRARGGQWYFHGYPAYKVHTADVVERYLSEECGGNDLAYLFFGDLDGVGHRRGPRSVARRDQLRMLDAGLRRIYEHARVNYEVVDLLVFGDHGMVDVTRHVDMRQTIRKANLNRRNATYFLDSTMARFWTADADRRKRLLNLLSKQDGGHVLSDAECKQHRIRYPHNYFGDIIFAVEDGALIHPSFYEAESAPKGMHGYLPGCRDNESAFV